MFVSGGRLLACAAALSSACSVDESVCEGDGLAIEIVPEQQDACALVEYQPVVVIDGKRLTDVLEYSHHSGFTRIVYRWPFVEPGAHGTISITGSGGRPGVFVEGEATFVADPSTCLRVALTATCTLN
jgi:hypothetical protein